MELVDMATISTNGKALRIIAGFLVGTYVATLIYSLQATGWDFVKALRFSLLASLVTYPLMIMFAYPTYLFLKKKKKLNFISTILGSFGCVFIGGGLMMFVLPLPELYREGETVLVEGGKLTAEGRAKELGDLIMISIYASFGGIVFWLIAIKDWKRHLTRS